MAFSKSIQKGQFPKCCELCEADIKINWKCINCDLLMCTKCKEKVHSKIKSAEKHKIIDIKEVGKESEILDFSNIDCQGHEGQVCVLFCNSCTKLVCPQCIAEIHNGHGLVPVSEGYNIYIENVKLLKEEQKLVKNQIDELTNGESQIILYRKAEYSKYTEARNVIIAHNAALKQAIDSYTEKLLKELDQKWEILQKQMDQEEHKIIVMKTTKENQSKKADDLINSKSLDDIFREIKIFETPVIEYVEPVKLDFNTLPKFLPGEITEYYFGSLQDVQKDMEWNIHQQLTTDINEVLFLSSCPDNSLWISDQKVIQKVKPEGSNLKVMFNFNIDTNGIAATPSNDLLLASKGSPRLKQISSGQVTDSVYSVNPLVITAVHVCNDYKVIVGAKSRGSLYPATGRRVVIRMDKEGKHEKTYEHDRNKQPIFTYVLSITSTNNGKIFVVDRLSGDAIGRVVILGQNGDVLNVYTGHPSIDSQTNPCKPLYAVTTRLDNIIVAEMNMPIFHILNSVGNLITYYNTNSIGILRPYSLSFTNASQLYIGCTRAVGSTDKAKLYLVDIANI